MCSLPLNQENVHKLIESSLKILNLYKSLIDSFVLDYYVDDHWKKLSKTWQECFENIDVETFAKIILSRPTNVVPPLSFLSFINCSRSYSILREPPVNKTSQCELNKMDKMFLKHVKLKKRHEIELMASTVASVAKETECNQVVDFGSGLGHLVRTLSYKYNLNTIGIEQQSQLTDDAKKLDAELQYSASKYVEKAKLKSFKNPTHLNAVVTFNDDSIIKDEEEYGLIGLHPCGDLGPNIIKHFLKSTKCKFICVVGCCFMKVTPEISYPMSSFVKSIKDNDLSYESREIACHAIDNYLDRLSAGNYGDLQVHSFRAMLELLIVRVDPHKKHSGIRSIKHSSTLTFQRYCEIATERLNIKLNEADFASAETMQKLSEWQRVVIFYTCRLILAPLVETVMLYDRLCYLWECGVEASLTPVFNPRISPRNHVLVAKKP